MARPKGSKNLKIIEEEQFREQFKIFCYREGFDSFLKELRTLKGSAYVKYFLNALEFNAPKLARTEHTGKDGKELFPPLSGSQRENVKKLL